MDKDFDGFVNIHDLSYFLVQKLGIKEYSLDQVLNLNRLF